MPTGSEHDIYVPRSYYNWMRRKDKHIKFKWIKSMGNVLIIRVPYGYVPPTTLKERYDGSATNNEEW